MTTPDPKSGGAFPPVGEVSLLAQQMPRNTETPQYPSAILGSTPGFSASAVRPPPGGPTMPELDALSLTNAISQMANAMFQAPPAASAPPTNSLPQHADTAAYSEPPTAAMAPHAGLNTAPSGPSAVNAPTFESPAHAAPYGSALNFDALSMEQPHYSFPLHEGHGPQGSPTHHEPPAHVGHGTPTKPGGVPHANPQYPSRTAQPASIAPT